MVKLCYYVVNAFTQNTFGGNPAAVCLDDTEKGLSEGLMLDIANQFNLSETAFIRKCKPEDTFFESSRFKLRWFTPSNEVPLCGHATLASASVLYDCCSNSSSNIEFETLSGILRADYVGKNSITLNFPQNQPVPIDPREFKDLGNLVNLVTAQHNIKDIQISVTAKKLLIRLQDELGSNFLESLEPNTSQFPVAYLKNDIKGLIVTVKGDKESNIAGYDFYSRYFAPWNGIPEDPVTGSAHTVLGPYWGNILDKTNLKAFQCSKRGGELGLDITDDNRIHLVGFTMIVMEGTMLLFQ